MMNCWHCGPDVQLIWGGDHDMDGEDLKNMVWLLISLVLNVILL